tara:strand:- start:68 stop:496 length:429 start_codon:yes stop_codon:yes gene_type:complete
LNYTHIITKLLPDGTVNVPDIVIVPTAIAFLPDAIDMSVNVCGLVIKNVDDKLEEVIVPSVGVPISLLCPSTLPLKLSDDAGGEVNVICDPLILYADVYCTTPDIDMIAFASVCGNTAVPPDVRLNVTLEALKPLDMSSSSI